MSGKRNLAIISILIVYLLYGLLVINWQSFYAIDGRRYFTVADDALITFRYGWNLAHGKGLVWNAGEYVEGTTSILWSVYAAGLSLVLDKRFLPLGMQLSAILFMMITALGFGCIARSFFERTEGLTRFGIIELAASLLPLSYFPFVYWSLKGMETSLQGALIATALCAFFQSRNRPSPLGSTLLGLTYLTRPDSMVASGVILLFRGFTYLRKERWLINIVKEIFPFACIFLVASVFRYLYYGSLVPNTYILKVSGLSLLERIRLNGVGYITPFLNISWPVLVLLLISIIFRPNIEKITLAAMTGSMLVYTVCVGGDAFPNWRFLAVFMPYSFLALLVDVPKVSQMARNIFKNKLSKSFIYIFITSVSLILLFTISRPHKFNTYFQALRYPQEDDIGNINTSLYLEYVLKPTASVGVFYAGSIPYYTGLYAVDFLGKSDPYIAHLPPDVTGSVAWGGLTSVPGHNKYDLKYSILEKRPTYTAGFKYGLNDVSAEGLNYYIKVPVDFITWSEEKGSVFLLKDSPDVKWGNVTDWSKRKLKRE